MSVREHWINVRVNPEELVRIREKQKELGIRNTGAYMRKMAMDGYCVNLDLSDVAQVSTLLRRCSNNLNQYAKRANESGSIYAEDIRDLQKRLDELWEMQKLILKRLYVSPVKSIGHGITTMQDLENNAEVWCVMLELVQEIGTKLRTHKKKAGGIAISIRNNELFTKEWQCRISIPTQSPTYLAKTAFSLFAKNYQWEHPIRSVTVRAINLFEEDCPIQYDLFTDVKSLDRQERLDAAIEQIRFRFGKDAIKNGVLFQKSKMPTERKVDLVMPTGMIG